MASRTQDTQDTGTDVRGADATGAGRKALCGQDLGNGAKCELWKDHEGDHNSLAITTDDLAMDFIPEDEIADLVRTTAVRSAEQVSVDNSLDRNYQEYLKRGGENPVWSRFTVQRAKARKIRLYLRNAADNHEPPIQVRIAEKFVAGDQTVIAFAGMKRRKYERKSGTGSAAQ